jgi:hypothetical protein
MVHCMLYQLLHCTNPLVVCVIVALQSLPHHWQICNSALLHCRNQQIPRIADHICCPIQLHKILYCLAVATLQSCLEANSQHVLALWIALRQQHL